MARIGNTTTGESKPVRHSKSRKSKDRPSIERGPPPGWTRATFIVRQDHLDKLKALAYWKRRTMKELVQEALANHLKGKRVKAIPKRKV